MKYDNKKIKISEHENGYNLKGEYMGGLRTYILKIGKTMPEWIEMFKENFIKDYEITNERNPTLYLLNGVIESLLSVCKLNFFQ